MRQLVPALLGLVLAACAQPGVRDEASPARIDATAAPVPPVAQIRPHDVRAPHGATRNDPYYWLRDDTRKDPDVLAWLAAENAYTDAMMEPLAPLVETLYQEIVGRIARDDASAPWFDDGYWYYTRFEADGEYPIEARRAGTMDAAEEILLDGNALAQGKPFHQIGDWAVSPDGRRIAWLQDDVGNNQFTLKVKDIASGRVFEDRIDNLSATVAWANDNRTLFYLQNDPTTLLGRWVKRHTLGQPATADALVQEEADTSFYQSLMRTASDEYVCIALTSTVSSEMRCADADAPETFRVFAARERDVEYAADHLDGRWVIRTNWKAPNYQLMTADTDAWGDRARWREWRAHDAAVFVEDFRLLHGVVAIQERSGALQRVRVVPDAGAEYLVDADEAAYAMTLDNNPEPEARTLRYHYTSFTTPNSVHELDLATKSRRLLKQQPVLGGFDATNYTTERVWATARDGARVPVSVVYRKGTPRDGTAPLLQTAYGSYGNSRDPQFNPALLSLLDRGVVVALAHVRGGQEMGRAWYDAGRMRQKKNTFTDFIDVTRELVEQGYGARDRIGAGGGSAGGLLIGAVANMAPRDYAVLNANVPFVDVVTTMLDASIPLTSNEYDEWGNPADPGDYAYMLSYSPYDQVSAQNYPALYVTTGLWDSQVQYFEPAKWVAKLRATRTGDSPLLLRTNMEAGHGGNSGRFRRQRQTAEWYAFLLSELEATELVR